MKQFIEQKIGKEFQALYELSQHQAIQNSSLKRALLDRVKDLKAQFKVTPADKLTRKSNTYGNKGGWAKEQLTIMSRVIFDDKGVPTDCLGDWISIEVETIFLSQEKLDKFVSYIRTIGMKKFVTIKTDGSINWDTRGHTNDIKLGREIVISFKNNDFQNLTYICNKMNELGCIVNQSTGLHVHFDMRNKTALEATKNGKNIAQFIPLLKSILPVSRRNNRFCATDINSISGQGGGSRYAFVNLEAYRKHKTIEVRGHSGTTDAIKIINWIRLLTLLMTKTLTPSQRTSEVGPQVLVKIFKGKLPTDLLIYILNRIDTFNGRTRVVGDETSNDNNR